MLRFTQSLKVAFFCLILISCKDEKEDEGSPAIPGEGLVAHYAFSGNANDLTANNLDGTVHGAVLTADPHGAANQAYSFDGVDDYIRVAHNEKLNLESDFSISLWANVAENQEPEGGINDILRKWDGDAQGYPFGVSYLNTLADDSQEDRILFARFDSQGCGNIAQSRSSVIQNDNFLHVVLIREGDNIRTYVNNVLAEEKVDNTTCSTRNTSDMTIGCRGNLMRFFKGKIDDLRIYDRVLSIKEISQLYAE